MVGSVTTEFALGFILLVKGCVITHASQTLKLGFPRLQDSVEKYPARGQKWFSSYSLSL